MTDVKYRLKKGQKLTKDQIKEIERASELPVVFDEDSPEIDPVKTPELYGSNVESSTRT